jgi:hypothetical protein
MPIAASSFNKGAARAIMRELPKAGQIPERRSL